MRKSNASRTLEKKVKPVSPSKQKILDIQKEVAAKVENALATGKKPLTSKWIKEAMLEKGYSESSARCLKVTDSKTWNEMLDYFLPDNVILDKLAEHVTCEDKRVSLGAIQEANRLKNKYPAEKIQHSLYKDDMSKYVEVEYEE